MSAPAQPEPTEPAPKTVTTKAKRKSRKIVKATKAKRKPVKRAKAKKPKRKVRAHDQGAGGAVAGGKVKSQMMRIDPRLSAFIRSEAKRLTKTSGHYHTATDASRLLYATVKDVKLAPATKVKVTGLRPVGKR